MNQARKLDANPIEASASLKKAAMFSLSKSRRKDVPYTVNYIRFEAGGGIDTQSHEDEHFVCCTGGRCAINVDGNENVLEAGMFLNIPPHVPHGFRNMASGATEIIILKI